MDGGRRLLRSLKGAFGGLFGARPALAGFQGGAHFGAASASYPQYAAPAPRVFVPGRHRSRQSLRFRLPLRILSTRGVGLALAVTFLSVTGLYGAVRGGQYDAFVAANGAPQDVVARFLGFGINAVTITGAREIYEAEVLAAAGISERNSLLFLDVGDVRDRLRQVPLIKDVSVRKLYPNRLLVELVEREPFAVWQKDGKVMVVSADGTPIQEMTEARVSDRPCVVGAGATTRSAEFLRIVDAAGELRTRIRAGMLVGERRWTLKMTSGLDVKLPEDNPEQAITQFARLARDARVLDKDLVSVDLRVPDRMIGRLTEEAAAARADALARKKKAGQT